MEMIITGIPVGSKKPELMRSVFEEKYGVKFDSFKLITRKDWKYACKAEVSISDDHAADLINNMHGQCAGNGVVRNNFGVFQKLDSKRTTKVFIRNMPVRPIGIGTDDVKKFGFECALYKRASIDVYEALAEIVTVGGIDIVTNKYKAATERDLEVVGAVVQVYFSEAQDLIDGKHEVFIEGLDRRGDETNRQVRFIWARDHEPKPALKKIIFKKGASEEPITVSDSDLEEKLEKINEAASSIEETSQDLTETSETVDEVPEEETATTQELLVDDALPAEQIREQQIEAARAAESVTA